MTDFYANLNNIQKGFLIMGVGVASTFIILLLFYISIKLLVRFAAGKDRSE